VRATPCLHGAGGECADPSHGNTQQHSSSERRRQQQQQQQQQQSHESDRSAGGGCKYLQDTDFQPGDIASAPASSAAACCDICAAEPRCMSAAWNGAQYRTCYLKGAHTQPQHSPGTTGCQPSSKPLPPQPPHPPPLPPMTGEETCLTVRSGDLALCIGSHYGRVRNATLQGCAGSCDRQALLRVD
jgi:hypothetical protein